MRHIVLFYRRTLLAVLAAASVSPVWAGSFSNSARGTTSAGFLKLGVGARAVSMAEAFSAVADDAGAITWNPAGLTRVENRSATFMHAAYVDSSFFDFGAYAQRLGQGNLGVGVEYQSAGKVTERDTTGAEVGSFTPNDLAVSVSYARPLNGFAWGVTGKFIKSTLIDSAQTGALDAGLLSPPLLNDKLTLAFTVTNVGGKIKFEQEGAPLPMALRVGSDYKFTNRWRASLDGGFPNDDQPYVAVGTEYMLKLGSSWTMAGRLGYNTRTAGDVDGLTGLAFGLGFGFKALTLDYGFVPLGDVGLTHRVSVGAKF